MITENLSTLKIHKLTQAQYDRELAAGRIDATALYLTPDEGTQNDIYVQNKEPLNAKEGALWVDLDEEGNAGSGSGSGAVAGSIASDEDILELVMEMGYINPVVNNSNQVYTDNKNNVYIL